MNINRRSVLKIGALGASSYFLPSFTWAQNTSPLRGQDPHQLLHIHLSGAADFTYLFDARPLEMTNAGLLQNYSKEEPYEWLAPTNQRKTWASPITKPLIPFRQDLSIINGIFMDRQFVGHSQNENLLFTGNPFGGTAYMPLVNTNSTQVAAPLDGLKVSNFDSYQANNLGGLLPFGSKSAGELVEKIKHQPLENQSKTYQFILERMRKAGGNKSNLALGAQRLAKGYTNAVP
ncbi:MAG: hypothetical protein H6623_09105, partial [Bdellovibrionaceae bacterium]|nr:hypothetical protein [Pseudobdellovibrionaceae bacterium]